MAQVAKRLGVSEDALLKANPQIKDPNHLKARQDVIQLPANSGGQANGTPVAGRNLADAAASKVDNWASARAVSGTPAGPVSAQAPATGAKAVDSAQEAYNQKLDAMLKESMPPDMYRMYRALKAEVEDAHSQYVKTGKMPENTRFAPIEIKEGTLMSQSRRYDRFLASQGHNPENLTISDLDYSNRGDFLTKDEFQGEYRSRLEAAKKEYVEACPTRWKSTAEIESCQANITAKYFGQAGADQYRSDMAHAKQAGREYEQHMNSVQNGGIFSIAGRVIDLIAGGDGEQGAAIGGIFDMGLAGYAGYKGNQNVRNYNGAPSLDMSRATEAELTPVNSAPAPPPENRAATQPDPVPPPEPEVAGRPKIVQGSSDTLVRDSTVVMANRTGHQPVPLTKGSLVNTEEVTLLAHGNETLVGIGDKAYTPRQLAEALRDSGWKGGTIRLAACKTGVSSGGKASFAQTLASELKKLGLDSAVIAPKGNVNVVNGIHGLPQVRAQGGTSYQAPGKGWEIYVE